MGVCYCPRCVQRRAFAYCETRESQEVKFPAEDKKSLDDIFGGLAFTAFTTLLAITASIALGLLQQPYSAHQSPAL